METGKSALGGIDGNVAAAIGYPIGIIAIICLIMDKENRFVRFHALQSILLHVGMMVVGVGLGILFAIIGIIFGVAAGAAGGGSAASGLGALFGLISFLLWIIIIVAYVGGLIMAAVKAYGGNMFKLPIIGNMAEKWTS